MVHHTISEEAAEWIVEPALGKSMGCLDACHGKGEEAGHGVCSRCLPLALKL